MLSPEYFKDTDKTLQEYFSKLEEDVLRDVSRHLESATSKNQLQALIDLDYSLKEMQKSIGKYADKSVSEIEQIMERSGVKSYADDKARYEKANKHLPDYQKNLSATKLVEASKRTSKNDLLNITRTTGIAGRKLDEFYKKELSQAVINLRSGAYSSQHVINKVIDSCAERGLQAINYASGRNLSSESAVRMCVNTGLRQLTTEMGLMNAELMGHDLMEISAHMGARPSHAEWQGKIVSLSGKGDYLTLNDIGYGEVTGFSGVNCRHSWYPYFEGLSDPMYTDFEDPPPFEYGGKTYTTYEATQRMRALENSMRKEKRKLVMYNEVGDTDMVTVHKVRLRRLQQEYKNFSTTADLKPQVYRTYVGKPSKPVYKEVKKEYNKIKIDTPVPKTLEKINDHIKTYLKENNETIDKFTTNEIKSAVKSLKQLITNSEFSMRFRSSNIDKLLLNGRFKNQFETNTSGGTVSTIYRTQVAERLFGADVSTLKAKDFEKYGYLSNSDFIKDYHRNIQGGTTQYGDMIIRFNKEKVKDRVTFTVDNSLGNGIYKQVTASKVTDPSIASIPQDKIESGVSTLSKISSETSVEDFTSQIKVRYIELQFHGELSLKDVDSICFTDSPPTHVDELKQLGIKLFKLEGDKYVEI